MLRQSLFVGIVAAAIVVAPLVTNITEQTTLATLRAHQFWFQVTKVEPPRIFPHCQDNCGSADPAAGGIIGETDRQR